MRWSDGAPFTADDVIFTFDCILAEEADPDTGKMRPKFPSRYYEQYHINGEKLRYEKLDAHTVRFETSTVYAPFIYDIGQLILPKHKLGFSLRMVVSRSSGRPRWRSKILRKLWAWGLL